MKKQTKEDQEKRLSDLRCPVHGTGLSQIDEDRCECPRRDCHIRFRVNDDGSSITAKMADSILTVKLLEEWRHAPEFTTL
jgi:hypothetical protein